MRPAGRGFTLLEVAIVLAVLGILLAVAVPNYSDYLARQKLRQVAGLLEQDLRRARTLSVDEGRDVHVSFASGTSWCWGSSRQAVCDCSSGAPRCELGGVDAREYRGTRLQSGRNITFEAGLGRPAGWTRIELSNERNQRLHIDLNPLGRPQVCGADARKGDC